MQSPNTRNLPIEDSNYTVPSRQSKGSQHQCDTNGKNDDPVDLTDSVQLSDDTASRFSSRFALASTRAHIPNASFSSSMAMSSPARRNGLL